MFPAARLSLSLAASRHALHLHAVPAGARMLANTCPPPASATPFAITHRFQQPPRRAQTRRCSSSSATAGSRSSSKPRVVVVSWLGARDTHFQKYVQLWRELGHEEVVGIRPPMSCVLFPPLADMRARQHLLSLEGGLLQQPARPTVLHLLSGGGFVFTAAMLQQLALQQRQPPSVGCPARALLQSIRGVVLDSSPSPITGDVAARAITAALLAETSTGVEGRHPLLVAALSASLGAYLTLPPIQNRMSQVWATWGGAVLPPLPTLLLYSEADPLVPPAFVEDWGAAQARRGAAVQYGKWRDSPHVEHYRMHPQEYHQYLDAFVAGLETQ